MRIAAAVEYCGTRFHGWQRLKEDRSVQQTVEEAISKVADHEVNVVCAGRTDAGVHAFYQVIHFETQADREMHSWVFGSNSNLPSDVSILWARKVEDDFHARFSAISRAYEYLILNRPARSGIFASMVNWECRYLDADLMNEAAQYLVGEHDFSSYRAQGCQAHTPIRKIHSLDVQRSGDYVAIRIRANAFLYHMVRNISGVLMTIGNGKKPASWAKQVLDARDRSLAGVTAPSTGLYLSDIEYPQKFAIPPSYENGGKQPVCFSMVSRNLQEEA